MKIKSTVLLVAAALALSACTKSENTDAAAADLPDRVRRR